MTTETGDTVSPHSYEMTQHEIGRAFNEWLARYIADPSSFEDEIKTISEFQTGGRVPTYGEKQAAFLLQIHNELEAA